MKLLPVAALAALALAACSKPTATGPAAAAPSTVVATYDGKQITLAELDSSMAQEIHNLRQQALESMILKKLVKAEAEKAGKSEEELLKETAARLATPMSDEEAMKVYEANKQAFGGRSFDEVKDMIKARMGQEKEKQALMGWLTELKTKANVKITLPEPRIEVAATGPSKGPEGAPVTIVEFSDFECPFCDRARQTAEQVVTAYAGKVRLVFRDYPLPFHAKAQKAAEAGHCANEQGKFWEMHDWMFSNQNKLEVAGLKEGAKGLGLDAAKFDACLDSGKFAGAVKKNTEAGEQAGVSGTPAFFINGRFLSGAQPFEKFKEIIDQELAAK